MNKLQHRHGLLSVIVVMALAVVFSFMGYGEGHVAMRTGATYRAQNAPAPTHLAVIYERQRCGKTDFLHLEVDTTYHTRGKNGYCYEIVCDNNVSVRSFDREYTALKACDDVCFIEGGAREWLPISGDKQILEYACNHALTADDDDSWEAWYCDALPHRPDIANLKCRQSGLILAACNSDKSYTLRATHIKHIII